MIYENNSIPFYIVIEIAAEDFIMFSVINFTFCKIFTDIGYFQVH